MFCLQNSKELSCNNPGQKAITIFIYDRRIHFFFLFLFPKENPDILYNRYLYCTLHKFIYLENAVVYAQYL